MPLGLMELCYGSSSTVSCTQYRSKDWHARLGGGVHVEVIMGRTVHGAVWLKTGGDVNMRDIYGWRYRTDIGGTDSRYRRYCPPL